MSILSLHSLPWVEVSLAFLLILILPVALSLIRLHKSGRSTSYPPGPATSFMGGGFAQLQGHHPWKLFQKWGEEYGPLIHISALGMHMVILNNARIAIDLLEKRSAIYSDRPRFTMIGDIIGWKNAVTFVSYGERHKQYRRLLHDVLSPKQLREYREMQQDGAKELLRGLKAEADLDDSERKTTIQRSDSVPVGRGSWKGHVRRYIASTVLQLAYSYTPQAPTTGSRPILSASPTDPSRQASSDEDIYAEHSGKADRSKEDPYIVAIEQAVERLPAPGTNLVDSVPWLRHFPAWLPFMGFKRQGLEWAQEFKDAMWGPIRNVRKEMAAGTHRPSFTSRLLEKIDAENLSEAERYEREELVAILAVSLYSGGADTTASAFATFVLAMLLNPTVQARAQAEIDALLTSPNGTLQRLPELADKYSGDLPYITALVKEVFRWRPVAPLGVAHRATQDDWYNGYLIPKGAWIIPNIWSMSHNPELYADPDTFLPERFLPPGSHPLANGNGTSPGFDAKEFEPHAFGFGRRVCPGMHLAETQLWLAAASILSCFTIGRAKDKHGNEVIPDKDWYTSGLVSRPEEFPCTFTLRPCAQGLDIFV